MWLHPILTSALEGDAWSALQSGHYPPGGRSLSNCSTEDRVNPQCWSGYLEKKGQIFSSACNGARILQFPIPQPSNYIGSYIFFLDLRPV